MTDLDEKLAATEMQTLEPRRMFSSVAMGEAMTGVEETVTAPVYATVSIARGSIYTSNRGGSGRLGE